MPLLRVAHRTTYRYRSPVSFGPHRLMMRPRDSHDLRILATRLAITPEPETIRWVYDVFGNSIAIATFSPDTRAEELDFASELDLVHYVTDLPAFPIEDYARTYPFSYAVEEVPDLARSIERHYPDPEREVDRWARGFVRIDGPTTTLDLLVQMTRTIQSTFRYEMRFEEGTQLPVETLRLGSGTCRDFALLMMEAARALGFAARFVTGYIYSHASGGAGHVGGGATHAWLEIYLPGAGWLSFDPTNGIAGNRDLIRVAVVRDPRQALPLSGTWFGRSDDYIGVWVGVQVTEEVE
ncbi:transglutaminase family protein [Enterovirga rhinocerotis]|uniref:Transglutaminase-like putative cysteine protease n=1 Tax=Enterovirga rhinocerotis TaxID=1339210 RepID=A0A4R7BVN6_9HYPH|nr:transglutaminase family protein [Enterovirga rhinocerotis]TDR89904.1 transglutaminase-like putative cysteine protease [Enterovirga rhinocerotis]